MDGRAAAVTYAIEWRAAAKRYRGRAALEALDLAIPVGTCWGLLGPNGAGKTTALRLALGFARATAGEVRLQGHPPAQRAARIGVGLLPERLALPGRATPAQWLALHAELCGLERGGAGSAIAEALERTGIADRVHEPISSLSKGLRQRLGFATALFGAPSLLVLDEPGSGLDPLGIRDARGWIEAERARGATVLVSSHQLSEVERTCDHIAILDRGRIAASGELRTLVREGETLEDVFVRAVRG
jgi:ABC-2 type transport system ATP-binding protein